MKVLLVTTWQNACGIAEHSWYLKQAVEAADPEIAVAPYPEALDPYALLYALDWTKETPIVHLNYQASLHSRWGVEQIAKVQALGSKVIVTFHDTGVPNSDLCKAICAQADAAVVHEPFNDLPPETTHYWRMGVPEAALLPVYVPMEDGCSLSRWCRPVLGSIGFAFPWKNYDQLARVTAEIGWALLLIAPGTTLEQQLHWHELNPYTRVIPEFLPRLEALSLLSGCDATAFMYVCHNTGQSAAILQGIAARKPVHALSTCRQFRALFTDKLGRTAISWCETFEDLAFNLSHFTRVERCSPAIVALAEQDSWAQLGRRYAQLYRSLA